MARRARRQDDRPRRADVRPFARSATASASGVRRRQPRRRIALENLAFAFPGGRSRSGERWRKRCSPISRRLSGTDQVRHLLAEQMLAAADVEGEDRFRQARRQGRGVLSSRPFWHWEMQAIGMRSERNRFPCWPGRLTNPSLHSMLEESAQQRQLGDLPAGCGAPMLRELAGGRASPC